MSMVDFRCAEYSDGKTVTDKETRDRIIAIGIRRIARETGIDKETVLFVSQGKPVKAITLARVIRFMSDTAGTSEDKGGVSPDDATL